MRLLLLQRVQRVDQALDGGVGACGEVGGSEVGWLAGGRRRRRQLVRQGGSEDRQDEGERGGSLGAVRAAPSCLRGVWAPGDSRQAPLAGGSGCVMPMAVCRRQWCDQAKWPGVAVAGAEVGRPPALRCVQRANCDQKKMIEWLEPRGGLTEGRADRCSLPRWRRRHSEHMRPTAPPLNKLAPCSLPKGLPVLWVTVAYAVTAGQAVGMLVLSATAMILRQEPQSRDACRSLPWAGVQRPQGRCLQGPILLGTIVGGSQGDMQGPSDLCAGVMQGRQGRGT